MLNMLDLKTDHRDGMVFITWQCSVSGSLCTSYSCCPPCSCLARCLGTPGTTFSQSLRSFRVLGFMSQYAFPQLLSFCSHQTVPKYMHHLIQSLPQPQEGGATGTTLDFQNPCPYLLGKHLSPLSTPAGNTCPSLVEDNCPAMGARLDLTQGKLEMLEKNAPGRSPQAKADGDLENLSQSLFPSSGTAQRCVLCPGSQCPSSTNFPWSSGYLPDLLLFINVFPFPVLLLYFPIGVSQDQQPNKIFVLKSLFAGLILGEHKQRAHTDRH